MNSGYIARRREEGFRGAPDPLEAWRRDDPEVVARLASLELRGSGVRVPRGLAAQAAGDRPRTLIGRRRKALTP
jgi:hypothetical protein